MPVASPVQPDPPDVGAAAPPTASPVPKRPTRLDRLAARAAWTPRQRRAMAAVLAVVLAVLAWRVARDPAFVGDPQPERPARFDELADRLDPNTATWQELVAIPTLGEKRARAIVDHREDWAKRHPGEPAFTSPVDLVVVKGIGAGTVEAMEPYLMFPPAAAGSAAQPGGPGGR